MQTIAIEELRKDDVIIDDFGSDWTVATDPEVGQVEDMQGIVFRLLDPVYQVPSSLNIRAFGTTVQVQR